MKLGRLIQAVKHGMIEAKNREVQQWIDRANAQEKENLKSIYAQVAQKVDEAIDRAIDAGVVSLLDDYDVESKVFVFDPIQSATREIELNPPITTISEMNEKRKRRGT